jgi:aspartate aminotransferase
MRFAERVKAAQPSVTLALNARAKAMKAAGRDVVLLGVGEPDFDTPVEIADAAVKAIREGFTRYTATRGTPELRAAICKKFKVENGLDYTLDEVLVSSGAKHSLYNAFQALFEAGDEVIIFAPYWVSYPDMARLAGATPVFVQTRAEDGFVPRPEDLRKALTPRTRGVIFNSPNNPTGAVWSGDVIEALGRELLHHDCVIITDDIYEHLAYEGKFENVLMRLPELKERTLVVNGVSKTFAMTGWRIGYAAGPKALIDAMSRIQDNSTSSPNSIAQKAAEAALQSSPEPLRKMQAEFAARAHTLTGWLQALPEVTCAQAKGAFYSLPDMSRWGKKKYKGEVVGDSMRMAEILLADFDLALTPGAPFGAEGHLRLSFAAGLPTLKKGVERLQAFYDTLT